jgi:hypothetical protein
MDTAYSELPGDVEIVKNEHGRFEARSSERDVRMFSQPTGELARVACLTYLNARAVLERVGESVRDEGRVATTRYTREQYERACEVAGVLPLPDTACEELEHKHFEAPRHDAETVVIGSLAMYRRAGMDAEVRRQGELFEKKLNQLPGFRGLSREQYERVCMWIGAEPAAEEKISELKVQCFQQEETQGRGAAKLPLVLAKWRDTARFHERQPQ